MSRSSPPPLFSDDLLMTSNSISEAIARGLYRRSDKPNAKENQSEEWQAGYKHGLTAQDGSESIESEFARRGCIMSEGFREWKKGMWAAIMQRAELHSENWGYVHSENASDQTPRTQDVANTTDSPERLSASVLFVLGCSWWFLL